MAGLGANPQRPLGAKRTALDSRFRCDVREQLVSCRSRRRQYFRQLRSLHTAPCSAARTPTTTHGFPVFTSFSFFNSRTSTTESVPSSRLVTNANLLSAAESDVVMSGASCDVLRNFRCRRIDHGYASVVANPQILFIRLQSQTRWSDSCLNVRDDFPRCGVNHGDVINKRHADEQLRSIRRQHPIIARTLQQRPSQATCCRRNPMIGSITEMFGCSLSARR